MIEYFKIQDISKKIVFETETSKIKIPFSSGTTIAHALQNFIEIWEFPKTSFLKDVCKLVGYQ